MVGPLDRWGAGQYEEQPLAARACLAPGIAACFRAAVACAIATNNIRANISPQATSGPSLPPDLAEQERNRCALVLRGEGDVARGLPLPGNSSVCLRMCCVE